MKTYAIRPRGRSEWRLWLATGNYGARSPDPLPPRRQKQRPASFRDARRVVFFCPRFAHAAERSRRWRSSAPGSRRGMRQLCEFAQRVSPGARQYLNRVKDSLLRHPPDGHAADTQHLGGLLLVTKSFSSIAIGANPVASQFPSKRRWAALRAAPVSERSVARIIWSCAGAERAGRSPSARPSISRNR